MLNPDDLRRISQGVQQRLEQERLQAKKTGEEERRRRLSEKQRQDDAMADSVISGIPERLKEAASHGQRSLIVVTDISDNDLAYRPLDKWRDWYRPELKKAVDSFFFKRQMRALDEREKAQLAKFEADSLPPRYRKIYDWCVNAGYQTEFHQESFGRYWGSTYHPGAITIKW